MMDISTTTILSSINQSRASQKLPPLSFNSDLTSFAQSKLDDMTQNNYFSHTSPSGKFFDKFIDPTKYNYVTAGENLARDFQDVSSLEKAWMDSPLHKKNILNPQYGDIGIAIKDGRIVTFFGKLSQVIKPKSTNTKLLKPKKPVAPILKKKL